MKRVDALLLVVLFAGCGGAPASTEIHSVVLFTVADLRADHVGASEAPTSLIPALDHLTRESVYFENTTAASAWRLPSLYALMSSRYVESHSPSGASGFRRPQEPTLAEILAESEFETAAFVGGADLRRRSGPARGFTTYVYRSGGTLSVLAPLALDWLSHRAAHKTFLWLHLTDLASASQLHDPKAYQSALQQLDVSLKTFLDALKEGERSKHGFMLVVAGDRGAALSQEEASRGLHPYDFWIRVPLVMRVPGTPTRRVAEPVGLVDVAPTILDWIGIEIPDSFQGSSLQFAGIEGNRRTESFSSSAPELGAPLIPALRTAHWKLMHGEKGFELYDLRADPEERNNRTPHDPQTAFVLSQRLLRHLSLVRIPSTKRKKEKVKLTPEMLKRLHEAGYW